MRSSSYLKQQSMRGYSLVELAIVLVILGIITASVTVGFVLKQNTQLQTIMKDISTLADATEQFKDMYKGLPGDLWNAQEKFGAANTSNGDGDGIIDTATEQMLALQHLSLAGLIKGSYTSTWSATGLMPGALPDSTYYFSYVSEGNAPAIIFSGIGTSQTDFVAIISPEDLYALDLKYDDSMPNTGKILALTGTTGASGQCVNGSATTDGYASTNANNACYFKVIIGKE